MAVLFSCSLDLSDQCFYTNLRSRKLLAGIELSRGEETWLETEAMGGETVVNEQVEQTLLDYLTPQVEIANNILLPTLGAEVNFELRHGFLQIIESNQFHEADSEDPTYLRLTGTINVQSVPTEYITTWEDCVNKFLEKYFSVVKTDQIQRDIGNLVQEQESLAEAWESTSLDAACGGNLMLKPPTEATKIIEDMSFDPNNNSGDRRIVRRPVNQVEVEASSSGLLYLTGCYYNE
ncbi:hypothetical protein GmHk_12G034879 [Glycine max]|nr:hypothetical protein GmHk_12G034879 [Glycine max]